MELNDLGTPGRLEEVICDEQGSPGAALFWVHVVASSSNLLADWIDDVVCGPR